MDITPRAARKPFFNFTLPYAEIPHLIIGRKTGPYYQTLADLQGKTLAVEQGFFIVDYVRRNYLSIEILELPTTSDAIDAVASAAPAAPPEATATASIILWGNPSLSSSLAFFAPPLLRSGPHPACGSRCPGCLLLI